MASCLKRLYYFIMLRVGDIILPHARTFQSLAPILLKTSKKTFYRNFYVTDILVDHTIMKQSPSVLLHILFCVPSSTSYLHLFLCLPSGHMYKQRKFLSIHKKVFFVFCLLYLYFDQLFLIHQSLHHPALCLQLILL